MGARKSSSHSKSSGSAFVTPDTMSALALDADAPPASAVVTLLRGRHTRNTPRRLPVTMTSFAMGVELSIAGLLLTTGVELPEPVPAGVGVPLPSEIRLPTGMLPDAALSEEEDVALDMSGTEQGVTPPDGNGRVSKPPMS